MRGLEATRGGVFEIRPAAPRFQALGLAAYYLAHRKPFADMATGALVPTLADIVDSRMGLARLSRPDGCYSFIGAAKCDSCWRACPLQGRAITMQRGLTRLGGHFTPTVDDTACTGCGKCEKACIAEEPAITVTASRDGQPKPRRA